MNAAVPPSESACAERISRAHISPALTCARHLAARAADDAAIAAYLGVLRQTPDHPDALLELATLALANRHRGAAATALSRAAACHPHDPRPHLGLGDLALEDGEDETAEHCYRAALNADPACAGAHRGLARLAAEAGAAGRAAYHAARGFPGHARIARRHPAAAADAPVLLLVAALGGNVPTEAWLDPARTAITAIHPEYDDPATPLPPHRLIVNAIADADRAGPALAAAARLCARSTAAVINPPGRVAGTSRLAIARRAAALPGWRSPAMRLFPASAPPASLRFPLLLRAPGYHSGAHFHRVECRAELARTLARMPGPAVLGIEMLPSQGTDGRFRKYRAVAIGGRLYPVHLVVADHWKVHDFTAAMAAGTAPAAAARAEEAGFLADMPSAIGAPAMTALTTLAEAIGLDYLGIDFALAADGTALLFEANPAMRLAPAEQARDSVLAYRVAPRAAALAAMTALLDAAMAGHPARSCARMGMRTP